MKASGPCNEFVFIFAMIMNLFLELTSKRLLEFNYVYRL